MQPSSASRKPLVQGEGARNPGFWLVPLNRCGNFVYKCCCCYLWMSETWALWALTNSEFNLFFKASTVISLQTTTASRTPSDESEYILTLFSVSQSYFLVFWNVARFICSYVSSFLISTQHCPVLRSLNLLKFIYFHICILIKYWTGESLKCI